LAEEAPPPPHVESAGEKREPPDVAKEPRVVMCAIDVSASATEYKGVSETHFFYFNTLFFSLLFLGIITLLQQMHESLPDSAKAEFASLVEGGNVFLAATMENGRVALGAIGEVAVVSFATIKEKVLEAAAEYSRGDL
jgi:hypothetical protein